MSISFYPPGLGLVLHVDNPGYGEILMRASGRPDDGEPPIDPDWEQDLYGPQIGEFFTLVTGLVLDVEPVTRLGGLRLPPFLTEDVARALLPSLQHAVIFAVAGTERYERTFPERDSSPDEPLCVRCAKGAFYMPGEIHSEWCDRFGHRAYGTRTDRWETAQQNYQDDLRLHELAKARARAEQDAEKIIRDMDTPPPSMPDDQSTGEPR